MIELRRFEPHQKTLGEIAAFLGASVSAQDESIEITGISSNSNAINEGELFLALPGVKTHGGAYLPSAVERGARAVLTDIAGSELSSVRGAAIPVLVVPNRDASDDKKAWAEFRLCRPCRAGGRGNGRKAKSEVC